MSVAAEQKTKAGGSGGDDKLCCEEFDPSLWDEKETTWNEKPFIKESTWCFLHIPLNFGGAVSRACRKIEASNVAVPPKDFVLLTDMISPWSIRIFLSIASSEDGGDTTEIPGAEIVKISGTFLTKVFEGPYKDFGKWIKEMQVYVKKEKGLDVKGSDMFAQYGTCPRCAKKYGKNYVALWVKVA